MNVNPSAASIAMQVMQQPSTLGGTAADSSQQRGALALVEAAATALPPVGMVGSIINTFA